MQNVERFKKNDYFFKWLSRTENECAVCGVSCILTTAFFEMYGDPVWLCERCGARLTMRALDSGYGVRKLAKL